MNIKIYLFLQTISLSPALTDDPFVSIECDEAIATIIQPMYPFRLVACASKLTDLQPKMFSQCHAITNIQVSRVFIHNHYERILHRPNIRILI